MNPTPPTSETPVDVRYLRPSLKKRPPIKTYPNIEVSSLNSGFSPKPGERGEPFLPVLDRKPNRNRVRFADPLSSDGLNTPPNHSTTLSTRSAASTVLFPRAVTPGRPNPVIYHIEKGPMELFFDGKDLPDDMSTDLLSPLTPHRPLSFSTRASAPPSLSFSGRPGAAGTRSSRQEPPTQFPQITTNEGTHTCSNAGNAKKP